MHRLCGRRSSFSAGRGARRGSAPSTGQRLTEHASSGGQAGTLLAPVLRVQPSGATGGSFMNACKWLLATFILSLGAMAVPASARDVEVYLNAPPPAPRYEVVPAPRHGYVWIPG